MCFRRYGRAVLLLLCREAAISLNQRCLQEGRAIGVGGSIEDYHMGKFFNPMAVSIRTVMPSEMRTVCNPKLKSHGVVFWMQRFKTRTGMCQNIAGCWGRLWQGERHVFFHLDLFKNFYSSIQISKFLIFQVSGTNITLGSSWRSGIPGPQSCGANV